MPSCRKCFEALSQSMQTKIPILYFKVQSNAACLVPSGYIIYYSTDVNAVVHDWVIEPVVGNRLTHQIQELTLDTTYYFKIQARNSKGMGPMSEPVQFRTPKSRCPKCAGERSTDRRENISKAYKFYLGFFLLLYWRAPVMISNK